MQATMNTNELKRIERALARQGLRPTVIEPTAAPKAEPLRPGARGRLRLMYAALKAGLEQPPGETWWTELSPLKATERVGVRKEVARIQLLSAEEQAAELLDLTVKGGL
jgi:hypothetical protein